MTPKMITKKLSRIKNELNEKFHVKALFVFGSVARNNARVTSDIDILVDYSSDEISLFEFLELKEYLESLFGRSVDLVTRDSLKKWMVAEIESQVIRVA